MRRVMIIGAALLLLACSGCDTGRKSSSGFRLPDGDPQKGQQTFVQLKCNSCHRVHGENPPAAAADPATPVVLGGSIPYAHTDGELVTSIIYPTWKLAVGYPREQITSGGISRMPDYGDTLTARQLADVVAFLQSRYEIIPPHAVR